MTVVKNDPPKGDDDQSKQDDPPKGDDQQGQDDESKVFDKKYVEGLREEAASWRTKFRSTETELEELKKAQMSEHEKAIADAKKEAEEKTAEFYKPLLAQERIKAQATGSFQDPEDVLRYLDLSELDIDDPKAITSALETLLKEKPYLGVKKKNQSIDQGPQGRQVDSEDSGSEWLRGAFGRGR